MCNDILISLRPTHCDNVIAGIKTVELRRRRPGVLPGTRVWIYTKQPRGRVDAVAIVEEVHEGSCRQLWKRFGKRIAISRPDFEAYLAGVDRGYAIVLRSATPLKRAIRLEELRQRIRRFHPPQFFKRLPPNSEELVLFRQAAIV